MQIHISFLYFYSNLLSDRLTFRSTQKVLKMLSFFKSRFQKVKSALSKTSSALGFRLKALVGKPWNEDTLDQLEQILYEADLGGECAQDFIEHLKSELRLKPQQDLSSIINLLKNRAESILEQNTPTEKTEKKPEVILIVGVNGSGKTT
ncbi:MAG: hypothetical protein FJZ57_02575, partial [Chlamydiae bacterium]|nr:hypothetical protein [Chlamydiota bacterium]